MPISNTRVLIKAIAAYVPHTLIAQILDPSQNTNPGHGNYLDAVMLFADVSGFTPMSEQLARLGKEGAEELTRVLNDYFSTMIALVHSYGGAIIKFGGDAITCMFAAEPDGILATSTCALAMQAEMVTHFGAVQTRAGEFTLRMKIGLSAGRVLAVSVGTPESGLEYILAGHPLDQMAEAEHHANAGEVVWAVPDRPLPPALVIQTGEHKDFCLLSAITMDEKLPPTAKFHWATLDDTRLNRLAPQLPAYLPPTVYAQLSEGQRGFVGEHRQVVSLFILFAGLNYDDDPQAAAKLQTYFTRMQSIIEMYGGRLNRVITGDKGSLLHVIFGAPVAHEDNEVRAVGCALELQSAALNAPDLDFITAQRIGVAAGYVFAGNVGSEDRREYTVMGDVVNLSARLMQTAAPSTIWLDQASVRRVEVDFICDTLPPVRVKGKAAPIDVWQAIGRRKATKTWGTGHPRVPIVGRDAELNQIQTTLQRARTGQGQLIVISGEAGVGKSCLLNALLTHATQQNATILGGDCLSYGTRTPYLPWIDLFRTLLGLQSLPDTYATRIVRIEQVMIQADPDLLNWVPLVAQMLGLPMPDNDLTGAILYEVRKQRTFEIALNLLQHRAQQNALLVLVIEDVHWIDEVSLELLHYIARNIGDKPILLVALHRPTMSLAEWARYPYYHAIPLTDLPAESALALAHHKLNMDTLPEGLPDIILRGETQVNPYFVEEVINALIDAGHLIAIPGEDDRDEYILTGNLSAVELPNSIQSLVMSRIDRLDESSKLTVKVASVEGRTFDYSTLQAIYPVDIAPDRLLGNLQKLDRLDLTPLDRPAPDWAYIFKHITTQEVAYESLLYAHRRTLHHRLANYIEQQHPDNLVEYYELLAHHYSRSEDSQKSWEYLVKAGDKAKSKYANEAAIAYYKQALSLHITHHNMCDVNESLGDIYRLTGQYELARETYYDTLNRENVVLTNANIRRKISRIEELQGHYDEAIQYLHATLKLLEKAEKTSTTLAQILNDLAWLIALQGDYEKALSFCARGERVVTSIKHNDTKTLAVNAELQNTLGRIYVRMSQYEKAFLHFNRCIEIREGSGDLYGLVQSYNNLAAVYWNLSQYDLVIQYLERSLENSQRIGYTHAVAMGHNNFGVLYYTLGKYQQAITHYLKSLEIRKQIGDLQGVADIHNNLGEVYYSLGDLAQSASYLKQAATMFAEIGDKNTLVDAYKLLASVSLESQDLDSAQEYAQQALQLAQEIGNREYEGSILRVFGQIAYANGRYTEAQVFLEQSIDHCSAGGNRLELARSHAELGRICLALHPDQGQDYLHQAITVFSELGLTKELDKVKQWLMHKE